VLQPYYDLAKLCRKEALAPSGASWFFLAAPPAAVAAYLTIPLLIPVLTTFGLPLGYMGDILGGGFLLSLASFLVAAAALETGSPYAQPREDVLSDHRAGSAVRGVHGGAADRH
jgi:formate hydrogenlyase subunit 4